MTIETQTDDELIELWDNLTAQINQGQTAAATSGIRVLSQIHMILAGRGYRPKDGVWVKADESEAESVEKQETEAKAETEPVEKQETESESNTELVAEVETEPTEKQVVKAETESVDKHVAKTEDVLES